MQALEELLVQCPHCWQSFAVEMDCSECGLHEFIEDCPVCCAPIQYRLAVDGDVGARVEALRPDD
jgi:hypothetical protein